MILHKICREYILRILFGMSILILLTVSANAVPLEQWNKTFGGSDWDYGKSVRQTTDGGYIIVGITNSYGAGYDDVYLIKTNASGGKLWSKTFGGSSVDWGESVQQTTDGGYIIVGTTMSYGAGGRDVYLIKTDSSGNKLWQKTFGGSGWDYGASVRQTTDGGYIIAGSTMSYGDASWNVYLIKTDSSGNKLWQKTFGGSGEDYGTSVRQTTDGGYIIVGSIDSDFSHMYLIKTDSLGNKLWQKIGSGWDYGASVLQTTDGGYIIAGNTGSYDIGGGDAYLIKTDSSGNKLWQKTFGGGRIAYGDSVWQTTDGGYIIVGSTMSYGDDDSDVHLIKTDSSGNKLWEKTFGGSDWDYGESVQQTTDGGYIIVGSTMSYGDGSFKVWLIKVANDTTNTEHDIAILVNNQASLDGDEENIVNFLNTNNFNYDIVDPNMIRNDLVDLSGYNVLYMRTGSEPTSYNDPDIISKINTSVKRGGKLILEYYGLYLGQYLGVGTLTISNWGPVVNDTSYFVEPISSSSIFDSIPTWSPPILPDRDDQLIVKLSQTGTTYQYPVFYFNDNSQSLPYWNLHATYGWNGLRTDSDYCTQHPGLCTSDRSVYLSDNGVPFQGTNNGIEFISHELGKIYKLGLNIGQLAPANNLIFGPVAQQVRKNVINSTSISHINGFTYPINLSDISGSKRWRVSQNFGSLNYYKKPHLGEDWNWGSGSDDLGKPVYAISNGTVKYAKDYDPSKRDAWEGVIIVQHAATVGKKFLTGTGEYIDNITSMYAHLNASLINKWVKIGDEVVEGQQIGIIGPKPLNSTGPHLHFELRDDISKGVGSGYNWNLKGWIDPSEFIDNNIKSDSSNISIFIHAYDSKDTTGRNYFEKNGSWKRGGAGTNPDLGYNGYIYYSDTTTVRWVRWNPNISRAGNYSISAFVPRFNHSTTNASYQIYNGIRNYSKKINQSSIRDNWVALGKYYFNSGNNSYIKLNSSTNEIDKEIAVDTMRFVKQ